MVKFGMSARPALTAERASSSRPSRASAAAKSTFGCGVFGWPRSRVDTTLPLARKGRVVLRDTRGCHPAVGQSVARAETQGFDNLSLCFFGATDINLTHSDSAWALARFGLAPTHVHIRQCPRQRAWRRFRQAPTSYGHAHGLGPTTGLLSPSLRPREGGPGIGYKRSAPAFTYALADPTSASTFLGSAVSARSKTCALRDIG